MFTIFYEWKSSLGLFKKDTLLLLLYSWYKLTVQVYKALVRYFWWLTVPFIGLRILQQFFDVHSFFYVASALNNLLFYIVLLLARPSLEKKDQKYVCNKGLRYVGPMIFTLVLYVFSFLNIALLLMICALPFQSIGIYAFLTDFLPLLAFFVQWFSFFLLIWIFLFLLDSKGNIRDCFTSVLHGYKMIVFNLPLVIILISFLKAVQHIHPVIHSYLPEAFEMPFFHVVLYPIVITLITTMYIKRVHDQCSLFFGRNCA